MQCNSSKHQPTHLLAHTSLCDVCTQGGSRQQHFVQVDALQPGVLLDHILVDLQHVSSANHVVHSSEAHFCHVLTHVLCHHEEEVDDVLRLSSKLGPQDWILQITIVNVTGIILMVIVTPYCTIVHSSALCSRHAEEVDDMLRLSSKLGSQTWVLLK